MPWRMSQGTMQASGTAQTAAHLLMPPSPCNAAEPDIGRHRPSATAGAHQRGRHCQCRGVPRAAGQPAAAGLCRRLCRRGCAALAVARVAAVFAPLLAKAAAMTYVLRLCHSCYSASTVSKRIAGVCRNGLREAVLVPCRLGAGLLRYKQTLLLPQIFIFKFHPLSMGLRGT
jgi:hypothetical protein